MLQAQLETPGGPFTLSDDLVLISEKRIIVLYCPFCGSNLAKDKISLHSERPTDEQVAVLQAKIEQVKSVDDIELVFGKPTRVASSPNGSGAKRIYFEDAQSGLRLIVHVEMEGTIRYSWSGLSPKNAS